VRKYRQLQGGFAPSPPDQGHCPWTPLGATLVLPHSPSPHQKILDPRLQLFLVFVTRIFCLQLCLRTDRYSVSIFCFLAVDQAHNSPRTSDSNDNDDLSATRFNVVDELAKPSVSSLSSTPVFWWLMTPNNGQQQKLRRQAAVEKRQVPAVLVVHESSILRPVPVVVVYGGDDGDDDDGIYNEVIKANNHFHGKRRSSSHLNATDCNVISTTGDASLSGPRGACGNDKRDAIQVVRVFQ